MDGETAHVLAVTAGVVGGSLLGLTARLGRFCTLAAIEDAIFAGNFTRWRMWVLAMAVAIVGVQMIEAAGLAAFEDSIYVSNPFNPVAILLGGLMFGIGMALVGTCGFGTLVRLGGGDLRSLLVLLVLGVAAFMAAAGPTAMLRQTWLDPLALDAGIFLDSRIDVAIQASTGVPQGVVAGLIAAGLAVWVFRDKAFRHNARAIAWACLVGTVISGGWLATGIAAASAFEPIAVQSFTFIYPLGQMLLYVMTAPATALSFGVGATFGVLAGAFIGALIRRDFRWDASDDAREARRQILGSCLMGTGGMYAMGCTIGQGLSGISVLAVSAPLALGAMWLGAWIGLSVLIEGSVLALLRSPIDR